MTQLIEGNGSIEAVTAIEGITVFVADSISFASHEQAGHVVVTGSHGGRSAGEYAAGFGFAALVASDAGRGLNDAGVAGLRALGRIGVAGVGVAHTSARIGDGDDVWSSGVVSYANEPAHRAGVTIGQSTQDAVARLAAAIAAASVAESVGHDGDGDDAISTALPAPAAEVR